MNSINTTSEHSECRFARWRGNDIVDGWRSFLFSYVNLSSLGYNILRIRRGIFRLHFHAISSPVHFVIQQALLQGGAGGKGPKAYCKEDR